MGHNEERPQTAGNQIFQFHKIICIYKTNKIDKSTDKDEGGTRDVHETDMVCVLDIEDNLVYDMFLNHILYLLCPSPLPVSAFSPPFIFTFIYFIYVELQLPIAFPFW